MLKGILSLFLGSSIPEQLRKAYEARLTAANDSDRIAADVTVKHLEARLQAQTTGEGTWVPKLVQALWALPFIIFSWKVIVWDKVLGWGVTDALGPLETDIGKIIVGFYFLTVGANTIIRQLKR